MSDNVLRFGRTSRLPPHRVYQRILREWSPLLPPAALTVALKIADRTLGWKKEDYRFTVETLLEGDSVNGGLQMSRSALYETLRLSEDEGAISRRRCLSTGKNIWRIHWEWANERQRGDTPQSGKETSSSKIRTAVVRNPDTEEGSQEQRNQKKEVTCPSPSAHGAAEISKSDRQKGASDGFAVLRPNNQVAHVSDIETLWRIALSDAFPEQSPCPWSSREKGQISAKRRAWLDAHQISFPDFVEWSVRNWSAIVARQFRWMTKSPPPKTPVVRFFVNQIDQFAECWADHKLEKWMAAPERTKAERLKRRGLSVEEVAAEIGKDRAVDTMREEIAKAKIEVRARYRQVQIAEQRVARMEAVRAPDPRSRVALGLPDLDKPMSNKAPDIDWSNIIPLDPNWEPPETSYRPAAVAAPRIGIAQRDRETKKETTQSQRSIPPTINPRPRTRASKG
jgi:hypothetical protein